MTWASVTLLLIGIISLNIIWGYPWTGMFAACTSLLFAGFAINRIMSPNLEIGFSLPSSAVAGEPFVVTTHVANRGRLPALEMVIEFLQSRRRRKRSPAQGEARSTTPPARIAIIQPGGRKDLAASLVFPHRGIHRLPDVVVTSMFPFHLFRSIRHYASDAEIAITPRPMTGDEDAVARSMLNTLGGWSHKLLSGNALDYTGSREYVFGMPVRRWDFASWARLGRPIVREFQSPSIQSVMMIVDTSGEDDKPANDRRSRQPENIMLERVLSLAATAVSELSRKMVQIQLYVTSEPPPDLKSLGRNRAALDSEPLLIRLAAAEAVASPEAQDRIQQVIEQCGSVPVLVLSPRDDHPLQHAAPSYVTFMRVDPAHAPVTPEQPKARRRDPALAGA